MASTDPTETSGSDRQAARERTYRMLAGIMAALFLGFGALGGLFLWYDSATSWVSHTHRVRTGVADTLEALTEAESAQRAYVLTADRRFIATIADAKTRAVRSLEALDRLTADNRAQQGRLAPLRQQMGIRLEVIDQVVAARRAGAPVAAIRIIRQGRGIAAMEAIRVQLAQIDATERQLETERIDRARTIRVGVIGALALFAVLLAAVVVRTLREIDLDREAEADAAERLRDLLADRTLLIDEVNHRVKNSLQQIASVVRLQSRASPHADTREALEKTLDRIMAVGRVHEQLYRSGEMLGDFDAGLYAETLSRELVASLGREEVTLETQVISAKLDVRQATPLALILNELITNALKYGCPPGRPCKIRVTLGTEEGAYRLSVSDDGQGLPPNFDPRRGKSLGMRAIDALTRQLQGRFIIETAEVGAHFALVFPRSLA
ncbi:sensor histidine kinase [Phenylobacterium aquaticum]|uniref:sensor histidine kinase n=1 Tax=Phenylobacterium aquaticum TaxID=1763816 RepID=UPI0026ECB59D|nr:CHASE3 domain-containing protein [Phenylobacterium aquaticum]